jgi:hypothetical protein
MVSVNLVAFLGRGWFLELFVGGVTLAYLIWMFCRPRRALLLAETELLGEIGLLSAIQIPKQHVEQISPSSNGVIISWRKGDVARYTHIQASWFHEAVWSQAYPALLSWAVTSSSSPEGSQEISRG